MHIEITHHTVYSYDREVQLLPHLLYLRPRENALLKVDEFALSIQPEGRLQWMRDDFDNLPASVHFDVRASRLEIRSCCRVTTTDLPPFEFLVRDYATTFPFNYEPLHRANLAIYLNPPEPVTRIAVIAWMERCFTNRPWETVQWLFALNHAVFQNLRYTRRDEPGIQPATTTIQLGGGSCRDYAVLLIQCARAMGLAARFVSGYMLDPATDGGGYGTMHAWVEIFLPGAGWRGLDPTHGIFCDNRYVPVAHAVVAESVNPIQGSFFSAVPAVSQMHADVRVRYGS